VGEWTGAWIAVHCGALGRVDRAALRRRERALHLLGFRELHRDLLLRPDNLVGGVADVRSRLYKLGLGVEATVFVATSFDPERERRARSLWSGENLTSSYVEWRMRLEKWQARVERLDRMVAARESFELGNDAIRHLLFDPLLPHPLTDVNARRAFVRAVVEFDRAGHEIWRELRAKYRASARLHPKEEVSRHADP
jgi:phenylacetic acid degradation operon negative regulatory protein